MQEMQETQIQSLGREDPLEEETATFSSVFFFNWTLITLQYCSGFYHTLIWISHGYTCVPHSELPSHLPPHPIPHGHPSAPALSTLSHTLNLDWQSVSHIIIYLFQCYSLKSSHPRLLPQSFQCFCLENPMEAEAWWATVHGVAESDTTEHGHYPISCKLQPLPWYSRGVLPVCVTFSLLLFQVTTCDLNYYLKNRFYTTV